MGVCSCEHHELPALSLVRLIGPSDAGSRLLLGTALQAHEVLSYEYCPVVGSDNENDQRRSDALIVLARRGAQRLRLRAVD